MTLPSYEEAHMRVTQCRPTPLDRFIVNWEPAGRSDENFREELAELVASSTILVSESTATSIERYTSKREATAKSGQFSKEDWEDARSDAVEALEGLFADNPQIFAFMARMKKAIEAKRHG